MFFPLGCMFGGGLFTKLCPTLVTPWTIARQASLSMGFSKQEYWSGLPFPSPGDLPNPGISRIVGRRLYHLSHQRSRSSCIPQSLPKEREWDVNNIYKNALGSHVVQEVQNLRALLRSLSWHSFMVIDINSQAQQGG